MIKNNVKIPTPLLVLLIIFFLPMITSFILYHYHEHFQLKTTNYGTLLHPPYSIKNQLMSQEKKWIILYIAHSNPEEKKIVFTLNQLRKALGKESRRVTVVTKLKNPVKIMGKHNIYLVDPLGNVFISYPNTEDPMHILKDLKKVLDASQIG